MRNFLLDALIAVLGMLAGAVCGFLIVHFSFEKQLPRALLDAAGGGGAVIGAATFGIIGANLRTWHQRVFGTTQPRGQDD